MKYTQQDFDNQMELKDKDTKDERIVYKDTENELTKILFNIQMEQMPEQFELSYQVMNDAINYISEHYDDDTEETLSNLYGEEFASIWISTRLSYLNANNEHEVKDEIDNGATSISTACAIYYDNQVRQMIEAIINKLNEK